jgi:DNA-binding protein H-NS
MNAFHWRGTPSETIEAIRPHHMARATLTPKRMHYYAEATSADAEREAQIAQVNQEVERHFSLAQTAPTDALKAIHRDEARKLAARVKALVAARPAAYVAYLEQQRGI